MLAVPSASGPRIALPKSTTSAFQYRSRSPSSSSPRNGNSPSVATTSLHQRDMTAETASDGFARSPTATTPGTSPPHDCEEVRNPNMRRGSRDEAVSATDLPIRSNKEEDVDSDERVHIGATGHVPEGTSTGTAIDIQALLQSPNTKRRQDVDPRQEMSSTEPQLSPPKRARAAPRAPKVLPVRYELCDVEDIVILIANMVSELIQTNDNLPLRDVVLTRFHSRTAPGISVLDYLHRLAKHAALTPPLLLSMVYYIDRLCSLYPAFAITTLTVHRFLITAATVAAKGLSDSFWNNSTYARVGGIKLAELGLLELEFLYRVDWRIVPNPEVLVDYYRGLVSRTGDYEIESEEDVAVADSARGDKVTTTEAPVDEVGVEPQGGRNTKWEMWMRDVAHTSDSN